MNLFVVYFPEIRLICSQCSDGTLFPALVWVVIYDIKIYRNLITTEAIDLG